MADSQSSSRIMNPWVLHLQKLGLELKCPFCLELYNKPILLPCDHIFCGSCVPDPGSSGSNCAICNHCFLKKDIRQAPFIESIVNIYRGLEVTCSPYKHQMAFVRSSPSPLLSCSKTRLKQHGQAETMDLDIDKPNQLSQGSPLFFGVNSSEDSLEGRPVKKPNKRLADEFTSNEVLSSTNSLADNSMKTIKKPKQESSGVGEMTDLHSAQMDKNSKDTVKPEEKILLESMVSSDSKAIHPSSSTGSLPFICGFCQTWKVTEYTGPMMHYANEKSVVDEEATGSDVTHVHSKCIEWAPLVYYDAGCVAKNLNKELQRGAKLKCCKCKLKGAALGCFAKSCKRSYHAPCAAEIPECRWDTDDYLMLCPVHATLKFPIEKPNKRRSEKRDTTQDIPTQTLKVHTFENFRCILPDVRRETDKCSWAASTTIAKNWVFCASSLSADEKRMLIEFASICGATVMRSWSPTVTHVIAAADAVGACARTRKVLMAILNGKWILEIDWIKACMEMKGPVEEEPYEIRLDKHGFYDGPKTGRLKAMSKAPKLFSELNFLFVGEFVRTYREDLQDLVIEAGGTLLESKAQLDEQSGSSRGPTQLIVYNSDPEMGKEDVDMLQRKLEAEVLAAETRSQTIPHTWLLDSIATSSLQPFPQLL